MNTKTLNTNSKGKLIFIFFSLVIILILAEYLGDKKNSRIKDISALITTQMCYNHKKFKDRFKDIDSISNPTRYLVLKYVNNFYDLEFRLVEFSGGFVDYNESYIFRYLWGGDHKVNKDWPGIQEWLIDQGTTFHIDTAEIQNQATKKYVNEINQCFSLYNKYLNSTADKNKTFNELIYQLNLYNRKLLDIDIKHYGE